MAPATGNELRPSGDNVPGPIQSAFFEMYVPTGADEYLKTVDFAEIERRADEYLKTVDFAEIERRADEYLKTVDFAEIERRADEYLKTVDFAEIERRADEYLKTVDFAEIERRADEYLKNLGPANVERIAAVVQRVDDAGDDPQTNVRDTRAKVLCLVCAATGLAMTSALSSPERDVLLQMADDLWAVTGAVGELKGSPHLVGFLALAQVVSYVKKKRGPADRSGS